MFLRRKLRFLNLIQSNVNGVRQLRGSPRPIPVFEILPDHKRTQDDQNSRDSLTGNLNLNYYQGKTNLPRSLNGPTVPGRIEDFLENNLDTEDNEPNSKSLSKFQEKKDFVPTFNLAAYINKSTTLQEFVKLGVDLHNIERRKGLAEFILRLDFESNVKPYLLFLQDQGVPPDLYGQLITKNPLLFKVDLDDLQTRVNYLEAKKFTPEQRQRIFSLNPFWLMFSTRRIDRRLGYFQQEFRLSGNNIRFLASKQPKLVTYNMESVRKATFCIREEMGFDADEIKCLLLSKPRLWMMKSDMLIERFAYAHNEMQLSHDMLLQCPEVLTSREFRLRERHEFLKSLGLAQYDPKKDLYVSPKTLVEGTDFHFAQNVAKTGLETYELFLKTR